MESSIAVRAGAFPAAAENRGELLNRFSAPDGFLRCWLSPPLGSRPIPGWKMATHPRVATQPAGGSPPGPAPFGVGPTLGLPRLGRPSPPVRSPYHPVSPRFTPGRPHPPVSPPLPPRTGVRPQSPVAPEDRHSFRRFRRGHHPSC